jgi:hypothetical protein
VNPKFTGFIFSRITMIKSIFLGGLKSLEETLPQLENKNKNKRLQKLSKSEPVVRFSKPKDLMFKVAIP